MQKLLTKIAGTPEEALIARLTLRSMKQAKYATVSTGHFGLATPYYCHFTSPIRRYPDLQIHRIIKDNLRGRMNEKSLRTMTRSCRRWRSIRVRWSGARTRRSVRRKS